MRDSRRDYIADAFERLAQERPYMDYAEYLRRFALILEARKEIAADYQSLCDEATKGLS